MSLVDRLRRSLGQSVARPPVPSPPIVEPPATPSNWPVTDRDPARHRARRLADLRRELARIDDRYTPAPAIERHPKPAAAPPPTSIDEHGLLFRETLCPAQNTGDAVVARPSAAGVADIANLVALLMGERLDGPPLEAKDILFFDTETTGLSRAAGTLVFLVGVGGFLSDDDDGFVVDQVFVREPSDEPRALALVAEYFERARVIVSFNGRGFDLPLLRSRSVINRVPLALDRPHIDLLGPARRLFRHRLADCRLATIERDILGLQRHGDVSGAEAPRIYREFVQHGGWAEMQGVFDHNRVDVATLGGLLVKTAALLVDPLRHAKHGAELLTAGRLHLDRGHTSSAETCLRRGLEVEAYPLTRARLLKELARHLRRSGRRGEASEVWDTFRQEFPRENVGWVELAKYHEHVSKNLPRALELAESAPNDEHDAVQRRLRRLRRRLARRASLAPT